MKAAQAQDSTPRAGACFDWGMLLAYALIAGSAFLFTKEATKSLRPITIAALRLAIGGCGLLIVNLVLDGARTTASTLRAITPSPILPLKLFTMPKRWPQEGKTCANLRMALEGKGTLSRWLTVSGSSTSFLLCSS